MYIYYISGLMFFIISLNMFYMSLIFLINKMNMFIEWNSFYFNSNMFNMYIYIDWMTLMFLFTVFLISSMIMFYSIEYMKHDNQNLRFYWMLTFFIFSMMLMIISPNMLSILIGWDGLGLTSYCLIIFYQNKSSYNSGMLTILINRIGDIMIIMSISLVINLGSFNFLNYNLMNFFIIMFIIIASFTKSAQFPFSSWLPAAMAAPTPVSSLVHSSTLVTAGIYLMIRFNNIMKTNFNFMYYMMITGLITMLMAGLSANFEFDLKKIIAYSTLSQLGLMMMMLSLSLTNLVFFHLIIHAMFKSMMFMCAGIIIHAMNNFQDIRYMGMIKNMLPLTSSMMLISNYSLCGLPFFSGFYSKDLLLENYFMYNNNILLFLFLIISTMLTPMYSFRLMYYLMKSNYKFLPLMKINEIKIMNISMMILMILSIFFGMILNWILFNNIEYIFFNMMEKMIIIMSIILGLFMIMFISKNKINLKLYFIKYFLGSMWFSYKFNYLFINYPLKFGKFYLMIFDKGWNEIFFKISINMFNKKLNFINFGNFNNFRNLMLTLMLLILILFLMM